MSTTAEQEAERRYPENEPAYLNRGRLSPEVRDQRDAFEEGAEWAESRHRELLEADPYIAFASGCEWAWAHPPDHIQELLEAAREYREALAKLDAATEWHARDSARSRRDRATRLLWAAAAALDEEGGE